MVKYILGFVFLNCLTLSAAFATENAIQNILLANQGLHEGSGSNGSGC